MDTTKIFIDIDDEITFIAERIFNSPTDRIILVVPERAAITSSIISLKILKKYLDKYHQQLVLVTLDENGKKLASRVGFITRSRVGEVSDETWNEVDEKDKETQESLRKNDVTSNNIPDLDSEDIPNIGEHIEEALPTDKEIPSEQVAPEAEIPDIEEEEKPIEFDTLSPIEQDTEDMSEEPKEEEKEKVEPLTSEPTYIKSTRYVSHTKKVNLDGFDMLIGGDIIAEKTAKNLKEDTVSNTTEAIAEVSKSNSLVGKDVTAYIRKKENTVKKSLHVFNIKRLFNGSKKSYIFLAVLVIIIIFLGSIVTYVFVPSADIKIVTESKSVNETKTYTADPNVASVNISSSQLPSQFFEVTESASSSLPTTGSTTVGTNAKGSVTIDNYTSLPQTVNAGTVITTSTNGTNYEFTVDTTTTVPKEGIPGVGGTAGTQTVTVTAIAIGPQYNIAANNSFSFQGLSIGQLQAYNPAAFAGGTSKTVQTVSATDQSNLLKQIQQELFQKGQSDLTAKVSSGEFLINQSVTNSIVVKSYDNSVGTQAATLNLTLTTKTSGLAIKQTDLSTVAKDIVASQANGLVVQSSTYNIVGTPSIDPSGNVTLQINSKGVLGASLNKDSILNNIRGKSVLTASSYIKSMHGVSNTTITVSPKWLFGFFKHIPFSSGKINIDIISQGSS
jgi:hypothetical protein